MVDAISSSRPEERVIALQAMQNMGAQIMSVESALFDMMGHAKHPSFKAVSAHIKHRPEGGDQLGL